MLNSQELLLRDTWSCRIYDHVIHDPWPEEEKVDTGDISHGGAIRFNEKNEKIQKEKHIKQLEKQRELIKLNKAF